MNDDTKELFFGIIAITIFVVAILVAFNYPYRASEPRRVYSQCVDNMVWVWHGLDDMKTGMWVKEDKECRKELK